DAEALGQGARAGERVAGPEPPLLDVVRDRRRQLEEQWPAAVGIQRRGQEVPLPHDERVPVWPQSPKRILLTALRTSPNVQGGPMRPLSILFVAAGIGCGADAAVPSGAASVELDGDNPNPMLYRKDAHPFDRSIERWSELLWSYIYEQTFDRNSFFDPTGALCGNDQRGPVWFLPAVPGSSLRADSQRSHPI